MGKKKKRPSKQPQKRTPVQKANSGILNDYEKFIRDRLKFINQYDKSRNNRGVRNISCLNNRIITAIKNIRPEAQEKANPLNLDEEIFARDFAQVGCPCIEANNRDQISTSTAYALMIRDNIERQCEQSKDTSKIEQLIELEHDELVSKLDDIDIPVIRNVNFIHSDTDENINGLIKIIHYRLVEDAWMYPVDSKKRLGPTWELYARLLDIVGEDFITACKEIYMKKSWEYTAMAVKIEHSITEIAQNRIAQPKPNPVVLMNQPSIENNAPDLSFENVMYSILSTFFDDSMILTGSPVLLSFHPNGVIDNTYVHLMGEYNAWSLLDDYTLFGEDDFTYNNIDVNPFSMLCGYCLLADENSDHLFLPNVSTGLLLLATHELPWTPCMGEDPTMPILWEKPRGKRYRGANSIYAPKIWFKWSKEKHNEGEGKLYGLVNIAQAVWLNSGAILLPSGEASVRQMSDTVEWTPETAELAASLACKIMEDSQGKIDLYNHIRTKNMARLSDEREKEKEAYIENIREGFNSEKKELQDEIKQLYKKNDELIEKANEIDRERQALKDQLDTFEKSRENERNELKNLREVLYHIIDENESGNNENEDEEGIDETFPYNTNKRMVVFGGHESWRNGMREKIPNIILAPKTKTVNADLIRNADIVWIQWNCIAHCTCNAITPAAKKADVPIKYFVANGVISCSMEIINEDGSTTR